MKYGNHKLDKLKKNLKRTVKTMPLLLVMLGAGCGNTDPGQESQTSPIPTISPVEISSTPDASQNDSLPSVTATPEPTPAPTPEPTPAPTPDPGPEPDKIFVQDSWWLHYEDTGVQPGGKAKPADLAWYGSYYLGSDSENVIYLTFDCGYENGNTELILAALEKHNATGTFFMTGHFLESAPEIVKKIVEAGHAAGNHTYHHPDMSAFTDMADFQKELDDVANLFNEVTGQEISPFYRPPEGKCTKENLRWAKELGYHTIFWSMAHVDWIQDQQPDLQKSIDLLASRAHPGAIVLLHNTSNTNGAIIDDLLTKWEEMGYSFRPLSELTDPEPVSTP